MRVSTLIAVLMFLIFAINTSALANDAAETVYTCPMHPQIRTPDPGRCPICNMALETAATAEANDEEAVDLFANGDFTGWRWVSSDPDVPLEEVWSIDNAVIAGKGRPIGYLRTEKEDYENYVLTLEWRWPGQGGNNGVLVHTTSPGALGIWPKSLEVQLHHGDAGDFWVIGTEIDVENEAERRDGRRIRNLTDDSEKPLGEWNRLEITCRGDEVIVKVNGELVNHGTNSSVNRGAISLQSEGTPIEFRNVKLRSL